MAENQKLSDGRAQASLQERLKAAPAHLLSVYDGLAPRQRAWAAGMALCALAALGLVAWLGTRPDWRTLYAGLDPQDAREMAAQLTAAGIPFDVSQDGSTLRVNAENLDKARLQTTAKGGPKSGRMGFELFDKPNWIGSEFDEKVNYQRALEGELEHTIGTLGDVQSARVHLVLPHESLFTEQQRPAKASVVLKLRRRSFGPEQADSIRNLVASAVEDLPPDNVVLVDADGHATLGKKSASAEGEAHEQALSEKLIETLEPIAGAGNVRTSVNVEYDTSTADEVDETYDPSAVVTLSMQRSDQSTGAQSAGTGGVPGTASNAPNTQPPPNAQPPLFPSQSAGTQAIRQESATYAASKRVRHSQQAPGKIRRITAAVLINDRLLALGTSKRQASWQSRTPDEIKHLTELAQAAIGFDAARGDQVSVENIAFQENAAAKEPGTADRLLQHVHESQSLIHYGAILLAMLALLLFVVRPMTRKTKAALARPALPAPSHTSSLPNSAPTAAALAGEAEAEKQRQAAQSLFDLVSGTMKEQPAQSSRLLQSWINSE